MGVHFTQEQEAQLAQIARRDGKADAGQLRGEFIEEEEMDARFEEMLRS